MILGRNFLNTGLRCKLRQSKYLPRSSKEFKKFSTNFFDSILLIFGIVICKLHFHLLELRLCLLELSLDYLEASPDLHSGGSGK